MQVRLYAEHIEVWYAQRLMERMGRLRGEILKLAYEERMREERVQAYDVTITQLMLVIHDWPLAGDTFCQGEHNFDREEIGRREYNRTMASMSRAIRRLESRGLLSRCKGRTPWTGIALTPAGIKAAEELSVK